MKEWLDESNDTAINYIHLQIIIEVGFKFYFWLISGGEQIRK